MSEPGLARIPGHPVGRRRLGRRRLHVRRVLRRTSSSPRACALPRSRSPTRRTARSTPERDNAVLICHALSGDAHVAGWRPGQDEAAADAVTGDPDAAPAGAPKPGWWDPMVGPGKTIDTDRYFVICSNVLGGCSRHDRARPTWTRRRAGPTGCGFPIVTIEDMVDVQARLLDAARHRPAARGRRRLDGRHAGALVGAALSRSASRPCLAARDDLAARARRPSRSTRSAARRSSATPSFDGRRLLPDAASSPTPGSRSPA